MSRAAFRLPLASPCVRVGTGTVICRPPAALVSSPTLVVVLPNGAVFPRYTFVPSLAPPAHPLPSHFLLAGLSRRRRGKALVL